MRIIVMAIALAISLSGCAGVLCYSPSACSTDSSSDYWANAAATTGTIMNSDKPKKH